MNPTPQELTQYADIQLFDIPAENWTLLTIIQDQEIITLNNQAPIPPNQYNTCGTTQYYTEQTTRNRVRFLMGRTRDTVIQVLQQQLTDSLTKLHHTTQISIALEDKIKTLKKQATDLLNESQVYQDRINKQRQDVVNLVLERAELEKHLTKIRTAIGELKYNEILEINQINTGIAKLGQRKLDLDLKPDPQEERK